jgi:hypothetical protein
MDTVLREARIVLADAEANNVDNLTLGAAERLVNLIKSTIAKDQALNGGRTPWQIEWNQY